VIVAAWDGDTLSIDTPSQGLAMAQGRLAGLFGIAPDKVHIRSPFLGGGFGCKGLMSGPQVLGAIAARAVGRPVKLVLRREQMFGPVGHRAPTRQTLRLGTDDGGVLLALDHHTKTMSSTFDDFFEPASDISHTLYASTAIATSHEAVRADIGTPLFMRAHGAEDADNEVEPLLLQPRQISRIAFLKPEVRETLLLCTPVPSLDQVASDIHAENIRAQFSRQAGP
jgi:xanthine dehydrogenase YagR molybdenum-binding subunit